MESIEMGREGRGDGEQLAEGLAVSGPRGRKGASAAQGAAHPDLRKRARAILASIETVLHGKAESVELVLAGLLAGGHILIEDVPGVGKTMLARALARSIDGSFKRIQFTPDLLPSDILGVSIYDAQSKRFDFHRGPIFAQVVLADEINRTTPRAQSALLEAMNERQITVEGKTLELPRPFLVLATQNPIEYAGTYPLPEGQLDRFLLCVRLGYPEPAAEKRMLRSQRDHHPLEDLEPVASAADIAAMQARVREVAIEDSVEDYLLELVARTRTSSHLALGVSPRGTLGLSRMAQARAFLAGRGYCKPDDVKAVFLAVCAHRVLPSGGGEGTLDGRRAGEEILADILESVKVPL